MTNTRFERSAIRLSSALKSIGPNHALVHVKEINTPANIYEVSINSAGLDHADHQGVVIIPYQPIEKIEKSVQQLL